MKIIVGCEFSQIVTKSFRDRGHEAFSCDIRTTEGNPNWHIQDDILNHLNDGWDMAIFHPECTYLTVTANKWLKDQPPRKSGVLVGEARRQARQEAIDFFMKLWNCKIERVCIENPVGCMSSEFRKPDQIIQPFQFGHKESKKTCLWLRNLPLLKPTNIVEEEPRMVLKSGKTMPEWYARPKLGKDRQDMRNRTFQGIADAFSQQWG
jgi:hypothetical protein